MQNLMSFLVIPFYVYKGVCRIISDCRIPGEYSKSTLYLSEKNPRCLISVHMNETTSVTRLAPYYYILKWSCLLVHV